MIVTTECSEAKMYIEQSNQSVLLLNWVNKLSIKAISLNKIEYIWQMFKVQHL